MRYCKSKRRRGRDREGGKRWGIGDGVGEKRVERREWRRL